MLDIYGYCFYNDSFDTSLKKNKRMYKSQESILIDLKREYSNKKNKS
jgi:hypothetical protein